MTMRILTAGVLILGACSAGCTVGQTEIPPLSGPSTAATSITVTATPDTVVLNGQQSVVIVEARDASGGPLANLRVHLDLAAEGAASSCGRLSSTDVTTGSDGRASVVFTTPPLPLPLPDCQNATDGVTIFASSVGTNAQASNSSSARIRFLTPASGSQAAVFSVNFTISPNPGTVGANVTFSDAGSVSPGHSIPNSGFQWSFSDGATKLGPIVTHDFGTKGLHTATLTVTDDIGQSGFKTGLVTIN
jgi:chitodextrinase